MSPPLLAFFSASEPKGGAILPFIFILALAFLALAFLAAFLASFSLAANSSSALAAARSSMWASSSSLVTVVMVLSSSEGLGADIGAGVDPLTEPVGQFAVGGSRTTQFSFPTRSISHD